jgi:hypothetical protein
MRAMKKTTLLLVTAVFCASLLSTVVAAERTAEDWDWGPYFLGYETEPAMDAGGRIITSINGAFSDVGYKFLHKRVPFALAYELPVSYLISINQHEVFGHGSRAREYNLDPSFTFAATSIGKDPENNLQMATLSAGGTEGDGIMARRILIDLCQKGGTPANSIPMMFWAKTDLSLYVFMTPKPKEEDNPDDPDEESTSFVDEYEGGNDIAVYLATRQAQRTGGNAVDVWNRDYPIDFTEPELKKTYDQMQSAAIWNLADPMMWASMVLYVRQHLIQGKHHTAVPALPLGDDLAITVGTRAAMSPDSVTRFLDFYLISPAGVFNLYGRDLQSTEETTMGFGAGLYRLNLGSAVKLSVGGDYWKNPSAPEKFYDDASGWNVTSEVEIEVAAPVSLSFKVGGKSDGFFPGTPTDSGAYGGAGVSVKF